MSDFDYQYLNVMRRILKSGVDRPDRTGIGSRAIWGAMVDVDLADGFPIVTTRKTAFRIAFEETWFFLRGETDTKKLEEKKINIWKGNTTREFLDKRGLTNLPEGSIGASYSHQWRNFSGFVKVENKAESPLDLNYSLDYSSNKHGLVGNVFTSKRGFDYIILQEIYGLDKNVNFKVKFLESGYETIVKKQKITLNEIVDPYARTVYNVGNIGDISLRDSNPQLWNILKNTWSSMISRCYNPHDHNYRIYGARNVYVSTRWLTFSNFFLDVQKLENWDKKLNNWKEYTLDKDRSNKGYYSEKTCFWASRKEQQEYGCQHKGVDQVVQLLEGIKKDPNGRRHIISGWNPQQLEEMALPPCHLYNQYQVLNGRLNSSFVMRSHDWLYGGPFNFMGYALLNIAFSNYLNLNPGHLTYFGNDVHIYDNQLEMAQQQVTREPYELPQIELVKNVKTFDDLLNLQYEDFIFVTEYKAHPDFKNKPKMAV